LNATKRFNTFFANQQLHHGTFRLISACCSIFSGIANVPSNTDKSSSGSLADRIALVLFLSGGVNVVGPALPAQLSDTQKSRSWPGPNLGCELDGTAG
jgi:hypothetical protein